MLTIISPLFSHDNFHQNAYPRKGNQPTRESIKITITTDFFFSLYDKIYLNILTLLIKSHKSISNMLKETEKKIIFAASLFKCWSPLVRVKCKSPAKSMLLGRSLLIFVATLLFGLSVTNTFLWACKFFFSHMRKYFFNGWIPLSFFLHKIA